MMLTKRSGGIDHYHPHTYITYSYYEDHLGNFNLFIIHVVISPTYNQMSYLWQNNNNGFITTFNAYFPIYFYFDNLKKKSVIKLSLVEFFFFFFF